jgi:hypothetical protein
MDRAWCLDTRMHPPRFSFVSFVSTIQKVNLANSERTQMTFIKELEGYLGI